MFPIRDSVPSRQAPLVTWLIILANVAVFLYEFVQPPRQLEQLVFLYGLVPVRLSVDLSIDGGLPPGVTPAGGWLTLLTSQFLHGGLLHLVANMWTLWIFGDNVEDRMGRVRFLVFYLLCGVAAGLAHWFTNPASTVPTVGASGAVAGVMGAYFLLYPRARIVMLFPILFWPLFLEVPALLFLGFWFVGQLLSGASAGLSGTAEGGVAWWAHVGGFLVGLLAVKVFTVRPPPAHGRYGWGFETYR